jgi:hypothetical protein
MASSVIAMINRFRNKLSGRRLPRLAGIVLHFVALALLCSAQSALNPRSGSLPKDEPQAIYHPDRRIRGTAFFTACLHER